MWDDTYEVPELKSSHPNISGVTIAIIAIVWEPTKDMTVTKYIR